MLYQKHLIQDINIIFMFIFFINLNFINTRKVYLFNKGATKYLLSESKYEYKPLLGSNGTLFRIKNYTFTTLVVDNKGEEKYKFAILVPHKHDTNVQIGNIKENKEMAAKVRKEYIDEDIYKLVFEDKCLSVENNEILWENCDRYNNNQSWQFISPRGNRLHEESDGMLRLPQTETFSKTRLKNIKKKEKAKLQSKFLKILARMVPDESSYSCYIITLRGEDHFKMPKSTEIVLVGD